MSWQLSAFALLAAGLFGGFVWYERSRPDARIVALVGTLAAFAALGRIAFAAVPNVKPTTDIVLISGFALGGAPGYVVGAVAALTSNFFFGQGPWTPWQMVGWGVIGVAGALLALASRGRIGRLPLALVSFVLGFAFTAFQDLGDWVTYSDHSLAQLWAYLGKGVGFDFVHACGCFGFAMLFGPALIRTLRRFRTRIQVTWLPPAARAGLPAVLVLIAAAIGIGTTNPARADTATRHGSPVRYLLSAQNRNGGFGMAPGQASDPMVSAWVTLALADGGVDPRGPAVGHGKNVFDYLAETAAAEKGAGAIERTILAFATVSNELAQFRFDSLRRSLSRLPGGSGSVADQTNLTAFGILALRAAGLPVPARVVDWLAHQQDPDGGFNYATRGGASDVDDTGAVIDALAGTNHPRVIQRAVAFIRGQQNRDGGFGSQRGASSNAQSTAFATSGLIGARLDPSKVHVRSSASPIAYLRSLIQPDGAVDYARGNGQTPVWVTAQAEIALSGHTL